MEDLDLASVGSRIRALRGNLTQAIFSERLGLERKTIGRYESGERAPDALALLRLMGEFGADPAWVLTGKGERPSLTEDEQELLTLFRAASLTGKAAAIGALQGVASSVSGNQAKKVVVQGGQRIAGRDYLEYSNKKDDDGRKGKR
ncbi:MAG: transcriptional regulator [Alcaligenaceae bacterium]|nr:transcriptional regulator [Alcaligenaceae bacterium]